MPKDTREYHVAKGMEEAEAVRAMAAACHFRDGIARHRTLFKAPSRRNRGDRETAPRWSRDHRFFGRSKFLWSGATSTTWSIRVIPHEFWTMQGIDWLSNAVTAHGDCYCDVSMPVEVLMSLFPGERTAVSGAEFVGDFLLVKEPLADKSSPAASDTNAGTPSDICVGGISR